MGKSSIHVKPVKGGSEKHNEREKLEDLDYVRSDLSSKNESWKAASISEVRRDIEQRYLQNVGQKMQAKATPIREAVFLFEDHHTIDDAAKLADKIEERFGIKTFQIHMHRDEGRWVDRKSGETIPTKTIEEQPIKDAVWKSNLHGHLVFNWTDEKGKTIKMNRQRMAELQTLVAQELKMERGVSSDRKHLDALSYKIESRREEIELNLEKSVESFKVVEKGLLGREKVNQEETIKNLMRALQNHLMLVRKWMEEKEKADRRADRLEEEKRNLEIKLDKLEAIAEGTMLLHKQKTLTSEKAIDMLNQLVKVLPEAAQRGKETFERNQMQTRMRRGNDRDKGMTM